MDILVNNIEAFTSGFVLLLILLLNICEVKKNTNAKGITQFKIILSILFFMVLLPGILTLLFIFVFYRLFVHLILKVKHGTKYGGLIKGSDAFHTIGEPSNSVINCLMMVQSTTNLSKEEVFNNVKTVVWNLYQDPKFKSYFLKSFGYSYMLRGELAVDDCIKELKLGNYANKVLGKKELLELLSEHCNSPLDKNETVSWQVFVGLQPVNWKDDRKDYYPLLFRINHAVADGVTLLKLMIGSLADKQEIKIVSENPEKPTDSPKHYNKKSSLCLVIKQIPFGFVSKLFIFVYVRTYKILSVLFTFVYVSLLLPASVVVSFLIKANDDNILHGPALTGKKILAMSVEDSEEYFLKTKRIKKKIPGTSFPAVLLTAFSASLAEYFLKHSLSPPEYITATIPMRSGSSELHHLIPGECDVNTLNVRNKYSFLLMNLPIVVKNQDVSITNRLKLIDQETNILKNSVDYYVNYFTMSVFCAILPQPLVKLILGGTRCSTVLSILPGPPKVSYCGGTMIVSALVPWIPHLHNIGTTFSINTYDGRLHIGFSVDQALIPDQNGAQSIVDGIYKYLDLLEQELQSIN